MDDDNTIILIVKNTECTIAQIESKDIIVFLNSACVIADISMLLS